jgi:hypothetical protein
VPRILAVEQAYLLAAIEWLATAHELPDCIGNMRPVSFSASADMGFLDYPSREGSVLVL